MRTCAEYGHRGLSCPDVESSEYVAESLERNASGDDDCFWFDCVEEALFAVHYSGMYVPVSFAQHRDTAANAVRRGEIFEVIRGLAVWKEAVTERSTYRILDRAARRDAPVGYGLRARGLAKAERNAGPGWAEGHHVHPFFNADLGGWDGIVVAVSWIRVEVQFSDRSDCDIARRSFEHRGHPALVLAPLVLDAFLEKGLQPRKLVDVAERRS